MNDFDFSWKDGFRLTWLQLVFLLTIASFFGAGFSAALRYSNVKPDKQVELKAEPEAELLMILKLRDEYLSNRVEDLQRGVFRLEDRLNKHLDKRCRCSEDRDDYEDY